VGQKLERIETLEQFGQRDLHPTGGPAECREALDERPFGVDVACSIETMMSPTATKSIERYVASAHPRHQP
jgi:hypothetical protein